MHTALSACLARIILQSHSHHFPPFLAQLCRIEEAKKRKRKEKKNPRVQAQHAKKTRKRRASKEGECIIQFHPWRVARRRCRDSAAAPAAPPWTPRGCTRSRRASCRCRACWTRTASSSTRSTRTTSPRCPATSPATWGSSGSSTTTSGASSTSTPTSQRSLLPRMVAAPPRRAAPWAPSGKPEPGTRGSGPASTNILRRI
uniref:Uncharacterized protein n=1 Tax=Arundo donax TaxID=35708 RepID=A0A0A9D5L0_ARUDO